MPAYLGAMRALLAGYQCKGGNFVVCLTRHLSNRREQISENLASPADRRGDVADRSAPGRPYELGTQGVEVERRVAVGDHCGKTASAKRSVSARRKFAEADREQDRCASEAQRPR
jgi:hypothetical protein